MDNCRTRIFCVDILHQLMAGQYAIDSTHYFCCFFKKDISHTYKLTSAANFQYASKNNNNLYLQSTICSEKDGSKQHQDK